MVIDLLVTTFKPVLEPLRLGGGGVPVVCLSKVWEELYVPLRDVVEQQSPVRESTGDSYSVNEPILLTEPPGLKASVLGLRRSAL